MFTSQNSSREERRAVKQQLTAARRVFRRNRGAAAQFAREHNIAASMVTLVLRGQRRSDRLAELLLRRAAELAEVAA